MAIKIVVDTSVFISALISSKGSSRELICDLLECQFQRLSVVEEEVMYWLAIKGIA
jgi:predicted nucleic acid-binding protein